MPKAPTAKKVYQHSFDRFSIHKTAIDILECLYQAGYEAYLVGGAVRDALQNCKPKDFDIATNATPDQVRKVFRYSRIIGKRFKLVHVYFSRHPRDYIEVATFRAGDSKQTLCDDGMVIRDNTYGTLEDDAMRRDFTVNALYYDWRDDCIIDYHGGMNDIVCKTIRLIGEPVMRYREDPVRMLRAIRFMAKSDFNLDVNTGAPIPQMASMLIGIPVARLFEEYVKLFHMGFAFKTFELLCEYQLFGYLFPATKIHIEQNNQALQLVTTALKDTDKRLDRNMSINPGYLLAVFLWHEFLIAPEIKSSDKSPLYFRLHKKCTGVLRKQRHYLSIPKRLSILICDVWLMQTRFTRIKGNSPIKTLLLPKYRAGYDFLCLRYRAGEKDLAELVDWWSEFQDANADRQKEMAGL